MLGIASRHRSKLMPDTPTIAEMGLPGYEGILWIAILAPAGTPKAVIDRLAAASAKAARAPDLVERLQRDGVDPVGGTPAELGRHDRARIAAVARTRQSRQYQAAIIVALDRLPTARTQSGMPKLTTGPDPHPKKPKLKAPPGACDTHIHLFGPAAKYPFAPDSPYTAHDALPETFMALQDTLGLSTAVIVSPGGYGRNYSHARRRAGEISGALPRHRAGARRHAVVGARRGSPSSACAACA